MSYQGPIIVVSRGGHGAMVATLSAADLFPVLETDWTDAADAVARLQPAAVIAAGADGEGLAALARAVARRQPYLPLIVIDPAPPMPGNALAFTASDGNYQRLEPRLRAALRVQTLHTTVLRRLQSDPTTLIELSDSDPLQDATVLLIGRGAAYPGLSVALGERVGVIGTLSIESAAKHLNTRDLDGIILGEGFSPRVVDAFLTVLSEDARFRNFPIIVTVPVTSPAYELPNLEFASGEPDAIIASALPLIRQHAFESRLTRTLASIEAGGLLDQRTGLLTPAAFQRDLATAVAQAQERGGGLSVARLSFGRTDPRLQFDAARIVSRLMRRMDFGVLQDDGSILVVFADAGLRNARMVARRLSSVIKQTSHGARRDARLDPEVSVETLLPADTAKSMLARLYQEPHRAAS